MKTKLKTTIFLLMGFFLTTNLTSCKKETITEENDEEIITTLTLKLTPVGGGPVLNFSYDDADGPGGNLPVKETITLAANKVYQMELIVLNKTTNPVTDITAEIVNEADAHRFYFTPAVSSNIMVNNLNTDANGIALGTSGTLTTTNAANGKLTVSLRHYPGNPPDKATADPVNSAKSVTDLEVEFDTLIL
jgi:hypothetical protein